MSIDWPAVHAEAEAILRDYLRIDTTNPPGNESAAARFLGGILEAEGIATEYAEPQPGRALVHARLRGDGSRRPLLLGNHTDVVPVEEEYWTVPAFAGEVRDGRIYGRGAIDMKGCGVMQLIAVLLAHRARLPLRRDLVFLAVPDEEAGSRWGMRWVIEQRPDLVDAEYALNEGSLPREVSGRRLFPIAVNEKFGSAIRLVAVGRPGHGSFVHEDNSMVRLARALVRLAEWDRGITFTPETQTYVARLAEAGLMPAAADAGALHATIRERRGLLPMFTNTLNVTMVRAGVKSNVLPARSEATLDCRLLPGESRETWRRAVEAVVDDAQIAVELANPDAPEPPPATPWNTELFAAIESSARSAFEDAVVVPSMTIGATDNRYLRAAGVIAYSFVPGIYSPEELASFHGNDEFITVENLRLGCELTYDIVRRMCT
ncbi:MAG: M20/M25/M40 family metallo-hydrolase [Chloroflexi bacterium]|nr:M20/M25/M40 family metallo-hydrolase [Chloroflexota bacterium]